MSSNDKKSKKPKHLGDISFTYVTKINGKKYKAEIGQGVISQSLCCDRYFKTGFVNSLRLGEHQVKCKACALLQAKQHTILSLVSIIKYIGFKIFTNLQICTLHITAEYNEQHTDMTLESNNSNATIKIDNRKFNKGSSICSKFMVKKYAWYTNIKNEIFL